MRDTLKRKWRPRPPGFIGAGNHPGSIRAEDGFVIVAALVSLIVLLLIVGAMTMLAVQTADKAQRDPLVRSAVQAADTGLQTAFYRLNSLSQWEDDPNNANYLLTPCITANLNASAGLASLALAAHVNTYGSSSWCDPSSPYPTGPYPTGYPAGQAIGNGESFIYQMTPIIQLGGDPTGVYRRIVATGYATNGQRVVQRRVLETTRAPYPPGISANYSIAALHDIYIEGSSHSGTAASPAPLAANRNVTVTSGGQCGTIRYGPPGSGGAFSGTPTNCPPGQTISALTRPLPVPDVFSVPATNNDAAIACTGCTFTNGNLTISGNSSTILTLSHLSTDGTNPTNYVLCSAAVTGQATLSINDTTGPVLIYLVTPGSTGPWGSQCTPQTVGTEQYQFFVAGGASLSALNPNPLNFQLWAPGLSQPSTYLQCSSSYTANPCETQMNLAGGSATTVPMQLVAPNSFIQIAGGTVVVGLVYVWDTFVTGGATITPFLELDSELGHTGRLGASQTDWRECTSATPPSGSAPDQGC
jgi:Tfp pilus assembly protein PilX